MQNLATLDVTNSTLETVIFNPKNVIYFRDEISRRL